MDPARTANRFPRELSGGQNSASAWLARLPPIRP
jgi:hypothetical protein